MGDKKMQAREEGSLSRPPPTPHPRGLATLPPGHADVTPANTAYVQATQQHSAILD